MFTGADHGVERGVEQDHERSLPIDVATCEEPEVLVAYAMDGAPLPPQHGWPLRLVVPGWYGKRGNIAAGRQGGCRYCAGAAPISLEEAVALMTSPGGPAAQPAARSERPLMSRSRAEKGAAARAGARTPGGASAGHGRVAANCTPTDLDRAAIEAKDFGLEPLESYPGPSGLWHCRHLASGQDVEIRLSNLRRGLRAADDVMHRPIRTSRGVITEHDLPKSVT
ncbi:molybdopterin-dependent oxidoreductase [Streptomyces diastatochromogenes]|uniref:molybdopterin-dependent oxidoreductase n=1 Tax=Streptomyces diastatochromogenes TaxID=42236 RepID=UPI003692946B